MAREHLVNHETGADAWEFEEVTNGTLVLKTNLKKCVECRVGDIVRHNRGREKELILVYSR